MIMGANEWIQEIHKNAMDHGWWEQDRPFEEVLALIHSEWSEALEEDRAGRLMVWHGCKASVSCPCELCFECISKDQFPTGKGCVDYQDKPEGIAVELIDGCIRIMDWFGKMGFSVPMGSVKNIGEIGMDPSYTYYGLIHADVPALVCNLHQIVSRALRTNPFMTAEERNKTRCADLFDALPVVFGWLMNRGIDPEPILWEKHQYNITRPYKHGKQY